MNMAIQPGLSRFSSGRTTGNVKCKHFSSTKRYALLIIIRLYLAGRDPADYQVKNLHWAKYSFTMTPISCSLTGPLELLSARDAPSRLPSRH